MTKNIYIKKKKPKSKKTLPEATAGKHGIIDISKKTLLGV
jgi:hypothetical protein